MLQIAKSYFAVTVNANKIKDFTIEIAGLSLSI